MIKKLLLTVFIGISLISFAPSTADAACIPGILEVAGVRGFSITDCVSEFSTHVLTPIGATMVYVSASLFEYTLRANLAISDLLGAGGGAIQSIVDKTWITVRDFSNIFFIGLLMYASLQLILGLGGNDMRGLVIKIVFAGLLINFSLFFTRVAIDASNSFALTFYNAISPQPLTLTGGQGKEVLNLLWRGETSSTGVHAVIMQSLAVQSIYATKVDAAAANTKASILGRSITTVLVAAIGFGVLVITSIVFLAAAVMLIYRLAILIVLMATSPVPFVANILPKMSEYSKLWWDKLINQCIFLPVFLFVLYIGLRILNDSNFQNTFFGGGPGAGKNIATAIASGGYGKSIELLLQYGLTIAVLLGALVAASKFGSHGGAFGMKWAKEATGFLGRNTLGRAGRGVGAVFDRSAAWMSDKSKNTKTGRVIGGVLTGNYSKNKALNVVANTALAVATSGASTAIRRGSRELAMGTRAGLKNTEEAKYMGSKNLEGYEKRDKEFDKNIEANVRTAKMQREYEDAEKNYEKLTEELKKNPNDIATQASLKEQEKLLKEVLSKMSGGEIEKLGNGLKDIAGILSSKQFEKVMESKDISDTDKAEVRESRFKHVNEKTDFAKAKSKQIEDLLKENYSNDEKSVLKTKRFEAVKQNIQNIESQDLEDILKEDLGAANIEEIKNKRAEKLSTIATQHMNNASPALEMKQYIKKMGPRELSQLVGTVYEGYLNLKQVAINLNPETLKKLQESSLGLDERRDIATKILGVKGHSSRGYISKNWQEWGLAADPKQQNNP